MKNYLLLIVLFLFTPSAFARPSLQASASTPRKCIEALIFEALEQIGVHGDIEPTLSKIVEIDADEANHHYTYDDYQLFQGNVRFDEKTYPAVQAYRLNHYRRATDFVRLEIKVTSPSGLVTQLHAGLSATVKPNDPVDELGSGVQCSTSTISIIDSKSKNELFVIGGDPTED